MVCVRCEGELGTAYFNDPIIGDVCSSCEPEIKNERREYLKDVRKDIQQQLDNDQVEITLSAYDWQVVTYFLDDFV